MAVVIADLRTLAPELTSVGDAILTDALETAQLWVKPAYWDLDATTPASALSDKATKYLALHFLALDGHVKTGGRAATSMSAAGVSVSFGKASGGGSSSYMDRLEETSWGTKYLMLLSSRGLPALVL